MGVQLNHTIVPVHDKQESAGFLTEILGLGPPPALGPFLCIETANGVSLDYDDRSGSVGHRPLRLPRHRGGVRRNLAG